MLITQQGARRGLQGVYFALPFLVQASGVGFFPFLHLCQCHFVDGYSFSVVVDGPLVLVGFPSFLYSGDILLSGFSASDLVSDAFEQSVLEMALEAVECGDGGVAGLGPDFESVGSSASGARGFGGIAFASALLREPLFVPLLGNVEGYVVFAHFFGFCAWNSKFLQVPGFGVPVELEPQEPLGTPNFPNTCIFLYLYFIFI